MRNRTSWLYLPFGHGLGAAGTSDFKGDVVGESLLDLGVEAAGDLRSCVCGDGKELGHLAHGIAGHHLRKHTRFVSKKCVDLGIQGHFMVYTDWSFKSFYITTAWAARFEF